MITAADIKIIFESSEFKFDLEALSSFGANIKQEDPIVLFFAKYLYQQGHTVRVNKKGHDLVVNGTSVEFKYHFDCDMSILTRDLNRFNGDVGLLWKAVADGTYKASFKVAPEIYKDMIERVPDIFVWIVCARDLSNLTNDEMERVCMGTDPGQVRYNRNRVYKTHGEFLDVADDFLEKLQEFRKFSLEKATTTTNGWFPSAYHLRICEFVDGQKT